MFARGALDADRAADVGKIPFRGGGHGEGGRRCLGRRDGEGIGRGGGGDGGDEGGDEFHDGIDDISSSNNNNTMDESTTTMDMVVID